jgi:hypothetical protein
MEVPQPFAVNKAILGPALLNAVMVLSFGNHAVIITDSSVIKIPNRRQPPTKLQLQTKTVLCCSQ